MAVEITLVRTYDFLGDASALSLSAYIDGFNLAYDGWQQAVASDGDDRVAEALTLRVRGDDHDDLASKLQALDDKIREIGWHEDDVEKYGVWLRTKLDDETYHRQVLVTAASVDPMALFARPTSPGNVLRRYGLALERMPWWESRLNYQFNEADVSCLGGMSSYGTVYGHEPSRIARTRFEGSTFDGPGAGDEGLDELWMGFRTDRFGDQTNFVPVWDLGEANDSTPYNDTTSTSDATAYGDYKWRCTFGDESLLKRVTATLQAQTSDYSDQRGEFTVLVRAKVGASTVCQIQLKDGFVYTSALRAHSRVSVSSENWFLYPLGTVRIPPSRGIVSSGFLRFYGFELFASRTTGSGANYLDIDCLVLIPVAEGSVHVDISPLQGVSNGGVKYILGDVRPIVVHMFPDGNSDGWWYTGNNPFATVAVEPNEYALPVGAGSLILAGQRETEGHDLDDYATVRMYSYRRYRTLRGGG